MHESGRRALALWCVLLGGAVALDTTAAANPAAIAKRSACEARPAPPRVILISVDGLRPDAITQQTAPNIAALQAAGVRAATALNDLPSATLPNHASMLTGLTAELHGLLLNVDLPGTIPQTTLFEYAAAAGLRTAFFASKTKLAFLAKPGASEVVETEHEPQATVELLLPEICPEGPDLIFLHLAEPDSTGHREGWMSPAYLAAVAEMDALIGRIVAALDGETSRDTYILLTADHGGEGLNHFLNIPEDRRIPWIVRGPRVPAGAVLNEVVSTVDTTATVLWLLGVDVPKGLSGRARTAIRDQTGAAVDVQSVMPPVGLPCVILMVPGLLLAMRVRPDRPRPGGPAAGCTAEPATAP